MKGVATGDMGVGRDGSPDRALPARRRAARHLHHLRRRLPRLADQAADRALQPARDRSSRRSFGIGIKELWEVDPARHKPGLVVHTVGWPMDRNTYGGSFLYHLENNQVAVGFVIGLDYSNPHLSPFDEMQRFKTHPAIRPTFEGGRRIAYGARALAEGGYQSIPRLVFPGGALIGDTAGFLNVPKIKGTHTAMKSGIVCAEAIFAALASETPPAVVEAYPEALAKSWVWDELYRVRNVRPSFHAGLWLGIAYSALDTYLFRGKAPWTFKQHDDHSTAEAGGRGAEDRLSEAGRRDHLRQAVLGVPVEHQPRGKPADPPDAEGRVGAGGDQPGPLRRAGGALLPGRRLRVRRWR